MSYQEIIDRMTGKFKKVRESLRFTAAEMSKGLSIYRGNYYDYEQGKSAPGLLTLYRLGARYNISLNWLILDKGSMFLPLEDEARKVPPDPLGDLKNPLSEDTVELIRYMDRIPLLRHEILVQFHRFKEEHRDMVQEAVKDFV